MSCTRTSIRFTWSTSKWWSIGYGEGDLLCKLRSIPSISLAVWCSPFELSIIEKYLVRKLHWGLAADEVGHTSEKSPSSLDLLFFTLLNWESKVNAACNGAPSIITFSSPTKTELQEAYSTPILLLDILADKSNDTMFELVTFSFAIHAKYQYELFCNNGLGMAFVGFSFNFEAIKSFDS
ncbi:uncharacterized protein LOC130783756 isoform X2 [Actinidia eriantha]|uniref:uncharacterized protein LOC130783756 isoform X2 n=1 Tax=Actinidia eriantha TaxID=165200 RepID=UPI002589DE13|nr:uncharacterized protein LOC130783756 isoform X2 [Actinidia eriantha]